MKTFERKVYSQIMDWKRRLAGKYALLLEGARRVGKTFVLKRFVESEYTSAIYIDFSMSDRRTADAKKAFAEARDIPDLLLRLQFIFETRLVEGESCVVFDEVQRFPVAREAIKHLVAHGRFHYIESGSLVGIKENVGDIVIPSEEHKLKMFPLDFHEFLDATGHGFVKEELMRCEADKTVPLAELHRSALDLFRLYMVVGGMPQSVAAYVSAGEDDGIYASEEAKREIISLYEDDIGKYAKGYASKVRDVFRMVPSALNRHERKFHLAAISPDARMRRYENAFLWLEDAMLVNTARNAFNPNLEMDMSLDGSSFKCYLLDTGMLVTMAMGAGKATDPRILRGLLHGNLGINQGMFFENAVAQALVAQGDELRFYSRKDSSNPENTMEIDFIVKRGIKVVPVEVKSGRYRAHASLDRFLSKFKKSAAGGVVCCPGNYEKSGRIVYLPAYMASSI
jgi:predicted AAA+ superfamily ATPase